MLSKKLFFSFKTLVDWCRVFLSDAARVDKIVTGSEYRQVDQPPENRTFSQTIYHANVVNTALKSVNNRISHMGLLFWNVPGCAWDLLLLTNRLHI